MVFTTFSERTDSQTHSRTDIPENRMPPAPNVFMSRRYEINEELIKTEAGDVSRNSSNS